MTQNNQDIYELPNAWIKKGTDAWKKDPWDPELAAYDLAMGECAEELQAALVAIPDLEELAREVHHEWDSDYDGGWTACKKGTEDCDMHRDLLAALQQAALKNWTICPSTKGEHVWVQSYSIHLERLEFCSSCYVFKSAIETDASI